MHSSISPTTVHWHTENTETALELPVSKKSGDISLIFKWMLVFTAFLVVGDSWVYDTPGAIYTSLKSQFGESYSTSKNQVLYSVYNWPNVVLAIGGGLLIDRWLGLRTSTLILVSFVTIGQVIFSLGVLFRVYDLAVIGRFVYGIGGESLKVAQNTWIVRCSMNAASNMSLRFGLVLGLSRLAGAINFAVTPVLANNSVNLAVWIGTAVNFLSAITAVLLIYADRKFVLFRDKRSAPSNNITSFLTILSAELDSIGRTLSSFSIQVWLQFAVCVFYHVGVLLLYQVVSQFLQDAGPMYSERIASLIVSVSAFIAIPGTPLAGWLTDRYGYALFSILVACLLLIIAHVILILSLFNIFANMMPFIIIAFVLVGVSYSMATAVIWPLVPFLLPTSDIATGYGVMSSVENLGLAVMPLILSAIQDSPTLQGKAIKYAIPIVLLLTSTVAAALLVLYQLRIDYKYQEGRLNKPSRCRTILQHNTLPSV